MQLSRRCFVWGRRRRLRLQGFLRQHLLHCLLIPLAAASCSSSSSPWLLGAGCARAAAGCRRRRGPPAGSCTPQAAEACPGGRARSMSALWWGRARQLFK